MNFPAVHDVIPGLPGQHLRNEAILGRGAFGDVVKARDETTGALYAVKFPHQQVFDEPEERLAFLNELEAAARIHHPNVVEVLHVETASQQLPPYLVMEYVEGGTLEACLKSLQQAQQLLDLTTLQKWTTDLVAGITAINAQMLHRDLKPDNILTGG